jgi:hypothetical protein
MLHSACAGDLRRECSCPRREEAGGEGWPEERCRRRG